MITFSSGKIMLAGEWSVLETENPCIVVALDKGVSANIKQSDAILITAVDVGLHNIQASFENKKLVFPKELSEQQQEKIRFVRRAVEIALHYLQEKKVELKNFDLSLDSQISSFTLPDGTKTKIGLGSSAATIVATIKAIFLLHGQDVKSDNAKDIIFKLSSIAHFYAQEQVGSCFDIAASTYGGALIYKRFDPEWLKKESGESKSVGALVQKVWPALEITPLELPLNMRIIIGFVGYSADTKELVKTVEKFKKKNKGTYEKIIERISHIVTDLITALQNNEKENVRRLIKENRTQLKHLSDQTTAFLETPELTTLIDTADDCGAAAKFSGAGGGDCGIAVCFNDEMAEKVVAAWKKVGIYVVTQH